MSQANLHSEVIKNTDNIPPASSENHRKQPSERKTSEREELVKYMSNLPCYLEKGEYLKEKALNVGVLDWRRLKKWQYNHKSVSYQSGNSASTSNASFFSTDESSARSSRGQSLSPACPRTPRATLQSHLNASMDEGNFEGVSTTMENVVRFQDLKTTSNPLKGQQNAFSMYQSFSKNLSEIKLKENKKEEAESKILPEVHTPLDFSSQWVVSLSKGNSKIKDCESTSGPEELQELYYDFQHKYPCDFTTENCQRSKAASRRRFSEGSFPRDLHNVGQYVDIPYSCPLPCEDSNINDKQISNSSAINTKSNTNSSEPSQASLRSVKMSVDGKKSKVTLRNSTATKISEGLDLKKSIEEASRTRNPSPTRRFFMDFSKIGRISSSKDSSEQVTVKSGSAAKYGSEKAVTTSCLGDSCDDIPNGTRRSQSSPLRRLLNPLSNEDNKIKDMSIIKSSSRDAKSVEFSSEPSRASLRSVRMSVDQKKSKVTPRNSTTTRISEGSDPIGSIVENSRSRNPSPTRRFSVGLGVVGQVSGSRDSLERVTAAKNGSSAKCVSEIAVASSCLEDSSNDKPNGTRRSQSSPLRRLLDPLLKPKAAVSHPSEKEPSSADKACKSSNGQTESSATHSAKVKLDLSSCKNICVDDSHQNRKHGSSTVQALFQITTKNGLPLFTFAVDNSSDILAATMRKVCSSRKEENCWIYTFFAVHEVKKKNGWMSQGGRGKNRGFVPNVVAQMTVSDFQREREFVLFAADLQQADQQASELHKNDELAAIVVKFLKETPIGLNEESRGNEDKGPSARSQDLLSTTVILPGGSHGLPSKGEPSPLIERWKSGGLCDCGGWDVGCRLRVLGNQTKHSARGSGSSKTHHMTQRFELFSQGEDVDDRPFFSISPFKDGILSAEFNPSLSFLQAFSICIAVLISKKPYELSELSKLFQEQSYEEDTSLVNEEIKAPNHVQAEVPACYTSYPPLSPVGRV